MRKYIVLGVFYLVRFASRYFTLAFSLVPRLKRIKPQRVSDWLSMASHQASCEQFIPKKGDVLSRHITELL